MKYIAKILSLCLILCLICGCTPTEIPPQTPQTPGQTQPSGDPAPADPHPQADNLLLDAYAEENRELLPRGIGKDHPWVKSASGNTLTFYYPAQNNAFSCAYGKQRIDETAWMRALKKEYDITLHAVRKAPASSLAAQRLAMPSRADMGKQTSGKSATRLSLISNSVLMLSSISSAAASVAPTSTTNSL